MMKDGIVVAEVDVVGPHGLSLTLLGEDLARLEHLGDEHRALAFGRRREKMEILPDRAADRARYADVMLQSGPSSGDRLTNQVLDDGAALGPELALVAHLAELVRARRVSNHQSAKAAVADEDVGAEPQHEVGYTGFAGGERRRQPTPPTDVAS